MCSMFTRTPWRTGRGVVVVETSDPGKVITRITFVNLTGKYTSADDFDMTGRIESAYERTGYGLADFVKRKSR